MGNKEKEALKTSILKTFKEIFRSILKAEKGTTGRVNLTFAVAISFIGFLTGELFTPIGIVLVVVIVCSAITNQLIPIYSRRRRSEIAYW